MTKQDFAAELSTLLMRAMPDAGTPAEGAITLRVHVWSRNAARAAHQAMRDQGYDVDIRETARGATLEVRL